MYKLISVSKPVHNELSEVGDHFISLIVLTLDDNSKGNSIEERLTKFHMRLNKLNLYSNYEKIIILINYANAVNEFLAKYNDCELDFYTIDVFYANNISIGNGYPLGDYKMVVLKDETNFFELLQRTPSGSQLSPLLNGLNTSELVNVLNHADQNGFKRLAILIATYYESGYERSEEEIVVPMALPEIPQKSENFF